MPHSIDQSEVIAKLSQFKSVDFGISREEVEAIDIERVLKIFTLLPKERNISFHVGGYDDDERELPQIPEVRKFFRLLSKHIKNLKEILTPNDYVAFATIACFKCEKRDNGWVFIAEPNLLKKYKFDEEYLEENIRKRLAFDDLCWFV